MKQGEKMDIDKVLRMNLEEVAKLIRNGTLSPVKLVTHIFERINKLNSKLNAYITLNQEESLKEAKRLEKKLQRGKYIGPLHGIPIGLKDNIYTKNLKTTMGSKIYENYLPSEDAFVVKKLKSSGAIVIGKHNLHQFAYGPTGDRSYYGAVANPYDHEKMAGGSSSGSAAAVSAFLCYGAIGTDTSGSIRIPASFCGLVGMKPTYGRVSKRGVYPLSWVLDHVGPITRTIKENALILNEIAGFDSEDESSIQRSNEDFMRLIGKDIDGSILGILADYEEDADEEIVECVEDALKIFEKLGAKIKRIILPNIEKYKEYQRIIIRSDAYAIHENNLKKFPNDWDSEVKKRLFTGLEVKGYEYARALQNRQLAKKEFNEVLNQVNIIITPTVTILPPKINERYVSETNDDLGHIRWKILSMTALTNYTGFPSLTIPCGFSSNGLPIGVQLIGKEFEEARLYQFGYALEQELGLKSI